VELVPYTDADLWLSQALETDPEVMRELGGPVSRERILKVHPKRAEDPWYLKILAQPGDEPVGTVGIWEKELDGERIHETGWMLLPAYQGRGLASAALEELLARAREEPSFERLHAFPGVSNAPSNALCRKFGFELGGERDFEFAGRTLRCNVWTLELSHPGPAIRHLSDGRKPDKE
jgi:RimJ/RimL family protein N-acetyltransferase